MTAKSMVMTSAWLGFGLLLAPQGLVGQLSVTPGNALQVAGCVRDQYGTPVPGVLVTFTVFARPLTGYHSHHDNSRPNGTMNPASGTTGGDGCAWSTFNSVYVAGVHDIYGDSAFGSDLLMIYVWRSTLNPLPNYADYTKVGSTADHPDNHWGTSNCVSQLQQIATEFRQQTVDAATGDLLIEHRARNGTILRKRIERATKIITRR